MIHELAFTDPGEAETFPTPDGEGWEPIGCSGTRILWKRSKWEHKDIDGNEGRLNALLAALAEEAWRQADELIKPALATIAEHDREILALREKLAKLEREMDRERQRGYSQGYQAGCKRSAKPAEASS